MKNNYLGFLGSSLVLVVMFAATGNHLCAVSADIFFLAATISHRRQNSLDKQINDFEDKQD
jgi:hypothetical protein